MNILYGISFLLIIYYIFQWKKISNLMYKKLIKQNNRIDNKIQELVSKDTNLIEGFTNKIFRKPEIRVRNNCNSMFLENNYKGIYNNEINEGLFNYSSFLN
jgi:hypothetical protein